MIPFSNHHHVYYFVCISSIKAGREVVEDLSLRRIERRFRFCYHWRAGTFDSIKYELYNWVNEASLCSPDIKLGVRSEWIKSLVVPTRE